MTRNTEAFIEHVQQSTQEAGITVVLSTDRTVDCGGIRSNGCFDNEEMTLSVATGRPEEDWLPILCHEYGHFMQWREDPEAWEAKHPDLPENEYDMLDSWLSGQDFDDETVYLFIRLCRECELDCERRAVVVMEEWNLPIDITEYKKAAAAYVHFYNVLRLTREWYETDREPYAMSGVLELMPTPLEGRFESTSDEIIAAMMKHCY